jgi:diguanylate cyclase (GGDEF)-like protein
MAHSDTSWLLPLASVILALAAACGYWLGRHRPLRARPTRANTRPEISQALSVVGDLEGVSLRLRKALVRHGSTFHRFAARLMRYDHQEAVARQELCDRAEEMLKPAQQMTAEISHAYTALLQQLAHLSTFAELRTDPLTGTANRLALEETLATLLSEQTRHSLPVSLAIADIDFFKQLNAAGNVLEGDRTLKDLAGVLRGAIRQCDLLARYGGEEFLIVMPFTELSVASELAERLRQAVQHELPITVSIGVAASTHGDSPHTLLGRAEAALNSAKSAGRNCVYAYEAAGGHLVGVDRAATDIVSKGAASSEALPLPPVVPSMPAAHSAKRGAAVALAVEHAAP